MANNHTRRGPGGLGSGPRGGFRKPKDLRGTLGKLMGYLGRYKALLVIVVVLLVISSACSVAGSYLIKPLINNYILPGDFVGLAKMLCVMGGVYAAGALCSYGYARIMVHVAQNTVAKLRADLFNKMQKLPLKFFDTHTHGELMSRYTNDIETVSEAVARQFFCETRTEFLRKNSPVLRSKSETRSLASTAPKMEGATHVKGRVLAWGGAAFAAPPLAFCPWGSSYPSVASPASSAASWAATGSVYSDQP